MAEFFRDLRYAARVLLKTPATTVVAVLALALGIGVNASCLIMINSVVLHPLPYPQLDRIMTIWETLPKLPRQRDALTPGNYADLRDRNRSFSKVAAFREWSVNLNDGGDAEAIQGAQVSPTFFAVLGSRAAKGRVFSEDEDQPDKANVVVVSEGFWKRQLAGSADAIGRVIALSGRKYTVVGIMPDEFNLPLGTEIWSPLNLSLTEQQERASHSLLAVARLKPGVTVAQGRAEVTAIASHLAQQYPITNEGRTMLVTPLREASDEPVTDRFLWTLLSAAGFVLLLACANVGNLQMARATNRQRQIAVRSALGASRWQVARQLLAEAALLSVFAGVLGILLAGWNNDYMKVTIPAEAMRAVAGLRSMSVTREVAGWTMAIALFAGALCGLPATIQLLRERMGIDLGDALRGRGSGTNIGPRNRLRTALIAWELALALVLLVGAGLMVETFQHLLNINQGFNPKNLLTMQVSLPSSDYSKPSQEISFYDRALESLSRIPGVTATGFASSMGLPSHFAVEGRAEPQPGEMRPEVDAISARYLDAMRVPLLSGRSIRSQDRPGTRRVVVVSAAVAKYYWPNSDPLGRQIRLDDKSGWVTVVGVCGDVIWDWFGGQAAPTVYVSFAQFPPGAAKFVLRTMGDPVAAAPDARAAICEIDKDLPVLEVKSEEQLQFESRSGVHAAARTMVTYAVIALLLAVTGVYAVISYFVAARTHDIGVRMALGADRVDVFRLIMRQTTQFVSIGLAVGVPLAILLSRAMSSALFGVVNITPITFAAFAGILVLAAFLASYWPSRRAMRIDPLTALREE